MSTMVLLLMPVTVHQSLCILHFETSSLCVVKLVAQFPARGLIWYVEAVTLSIVSVYIQFISNIIASYYLRIKVHFLCLHWEMKGHWSRVNLVKRKALLKGLHTTSFLSFPNANHKNWDSILIFMLKRQITPKIWKKHCQFFGHVTGVFHWKIFATVFLCFITGEWHRSVNIYVLCLLGGWHSWQVWLTKQDKHTSSGHLVSRGPRMSNVVILILRSQWLHQFLPFH